jgi:hypothetical protein
MSLFTGFELEIVGGATPPSFTSSTLSDCVDLHKRNECTSPLSSASDQSDASSDEFSSVDNDDDAQTESGVHESTQSDSVDDVKEGDVAPPTISNSKPVNNDIKQTAPQHGVKTKKKSAFFIIIYKDLVLCFQSNIACVFELPILDWLLGFSNICLYC